MASDRHVWTAEALLEVLAGDAAFGVRGRRATTDAAP